MNRCISAFFYIVDWTVTAAREAFASRRPPIRRANSGATVPSREGRHRFKTVVFYSWQKSGSIRQVWMTEMYHPFWKIASVKKTKLHHQQRFQRSERKCWQMLWHTTTAFCFCQPERRHLGNILLKAAQMPSDVLNWFVLLRAAAEDAGSTSMRVCTLQTGKTK